MAPGRVTEIYFKTTTLAFTKIHNARTATGVSSTRVTIFPSLKVPVPLNNSSFCTKEPTTHRHAWLALPGVITSSPYFNVTTSNNKTIRVGTTLQGLRPPYETSLASKIRNSTDDKATTSQKPFMGASHRYTLSRGTIGVALLSLLFALL